MTTADKVTGPATAHAHRQLPSLLHLGCGNTYRDGWHNVDVSPKVDADEHHDLDDRPWPWPDDSMVRVDAHHVLEHLDDPLAALEEIARVLVPGGELHLSYPVGHTRFEDPTHTSYWGVRTARWLAGDGKHGHEVGLPYRLVDRTVTVDVTPGTLIRRLWLALLRWRHGVGPWIDQHPGVYGHVTAVYRREADT